MTRAKTSTGSDPFVLALRLLARRDYAGAELAGRLRQKGCDAAAIETALERCRACGYLDDERYAAGRAAALARSGRARGRRLLADLQQHGVDAAAAAAAVQTAEAEHPPETVLAGLIERRYPAFDNQSATPAEKARIVNYFLRRGFPLALVLATLQSKKE